MRNRLLFIFLIILSLGSTDNKCQSQIPVRYYLADSLYKKGKDAEAYSLLKEIIQLPVTDSVQAESYLRIGYILGNLNKTDSAIYFLKIAAAILAKQKHNSRLGRTYNGIGNQYIIKKNFREAIPYYHEALKNSVTASDSVNVYVSLLVSHLKQKNYDSGYSIIKDHLDKYPSDLVPYENFYIHQGKGVYFLSRKNYDSALYYLQQATGATADVRLRANVLNDIAETYRGMKNYTMAFRYQDSASRESIKAGTAENLLPYYDTYLDLYEETGNYKQALYYAKLGRYLSDSFFDIDKNNAMIDAEAKYQNQKTLAEKAIIEKDNSIKQRNLIITFIGLGLVALIAFMNFRNARIKQKTNELLVKQKAQVQKLADELAVANETKARLFSTIGHDLRSPVSSLYALLKMQEIKGDAKNTEMSSYMIQLLDTLEELLIWSKSQMEGFKIQAVKLNVYSLFEELRQFYDTSAGSGKVVVVNTTAKDIAIKTDENILKTILRNAISNAIANTQMPGSVILSAEKAADDAVFIRVQNPCSEEAFNNFKKSFNAATIKSHTHGFGITLIKEFAQLTGIRIDVNYKGGNAVLSLQIS